VAWVAPFHPDVQTYIPFYPCITSIPEIYADGDFATGLRKQFDPLSSRTKAPAYLKFVSLNNKVDQHFAVNFSIAQKLMKKQEAKIFKEQHQFEKKAITILKQNTQSGIQFITAHTLTQAKEANERVDQLIAELN
jgi:putative cell wall-binding protein